MFHLNLSKHSLFMEVIKNLVILTKLSASKPKAIFQVDAIVTANESEILSSH